MASDFFGEALGLDATVWDYPGALFFAARGYHHHLGTNIWAGRDAQPPNEGDAQLLEWTIELPYPASLGRSPIASAAPAGRSNRSTKPAPNRRYSLGIVGESTPSDGQSSSIAAAIKLVTYAALATSVNCARCSRSRERATDAQSARVLHLDKMDEV